MSGKKKKFHEKEAEEEKKSTAQEAEVVHTDPVIQDQTEASHVEEQPQAQVHMQDQRASQMHPQEQSQQSSQIHTQEQPASAELYEQLEAQLRTLRAESAKMQEELQKIRDRRGSLDRRLYRELLDSEVLGQIAACYVETQGKKELYGVVRKFLEEHEEQCSGIRASFGPSGAKQKQRRVQSGLCSGHSECGRYRVCGGGNGAGRSDRSVSRADCAFRLRVDQCGEKRKDQWLCRVCFDSYGRYGRQ